MRGLPALPRLLAVTSEAICRREDFAARARAIAATGATTALVLRAPGATTAEHAAWAERAGSITRECGAALLVHARPDLARAVAADGVQLRRDDLPPGAARGVLGEGWIGVSVHDRSEAEAAIAEGADFLVAGNVFATSSHPDRPAKGLAWLVALADLGRPVVAIGGITAERARAVREAGAWGIAAITALWDAPEAGAAARGLLEPWTEAA